MITITFLQCNSIRRDTFIQSNYLQLDTSLVQSKFKASSFLPVLVKDIAPFKTITEHYDHDGLEVNETIILVSNCN